MTQGKRRQLCGCLASAALVSVGHELRRSAPFKVLIDGLDFRVLLFETLSEEFLLLGHYRRELSDGRCLFLDLFVLFEKLVQQHRVHRLVAHGVGLPISIASY